MRPGPRARASAVRSRAVGQGASPEPRNLVEQAADAALGAAEETLEAAGAQLQRAYVAILAGGLPEGELDSAAAAGGDGFADDLEQRTAELVVWLGGMFAGTGRAVGLDGRIVPLEQHGQG